MNAVKRVVPIFLLSVVSLFGLHKPIGHAADRSRPDRVFTFEDFFRGKTKAYGRFRAINGTDRRFEVDLVGSWDGRRLTLQEDFLFDDGSRDRKVWIFERSGPRRYIASRSDVVGDVAVRVSGDTARFNYKIYLDAENRSNLVRFRERMTLLADGTVENRATVFKYGLPVGSVAVNFARPGAADALARP